MKPTVSVLMPVYNVASCVRKAMDSILAQTYTDFELVVVNDGSTDETLNIIQSYSDSRIRILNLPQNKGLVGALNFGLDQIKADYIIRMDADEICRPTRFEKQVNFMETHPDIGVSGTWYQVIGGGVRKVGVTHSEILYQMLNRSPFPHSSVIMRGGLFADGTLRYNSNFEYAEDLELWMRMSRFVIFANIPEVLVDVTLGSGQLSRNLIHSSNHNTVLRAAYLETLFPQLSLNETRFLSGCLNRILPERLNTDQFKKMLKLCDTMSPATRSPQLDTQLSEAVWFQLANNAPYSLKWIFWVRQYNWIRIPFWKYGWLVVKPVWRMLR